MPSPGEKASQRCPRPVAWPLPCQMGCPLRYPISIHCASGERGRLTVGGRGNRGHVSEVLSALLPSVFGPAGGKGGVCVGRAAVSGNSRLCSRLRPSLAQTHVQATNRVCSSKVKGWLAGRVCFIQGCFLVE